MDEIMLKIDNVSKQYKLGQIGGTTVQMMFVCLGFAVANQNQSHFSFCSNPQKTR